MRFKISALTAAQLTRGLEAILAPRTGPFIRSTGI